MKRRTRNQAMPFIVVVLAILFLVNVSNMKVDDSREAILLQPTASVAEDYAANVDGIAVINCLASLPYTVFTGSHASTSYVESYCGSGYGILGDYTGDDDPVPDVCYDCESGGQDCGVFCSCGICYDCGPCDNVCIPEIEYGAWSTCSNGWKTRSMLDTKCGTGTQYESIPCIGECPSESLSDGTIYVPLGKPGEYTCNLGIVRQCSSDGDWVRTPELYCQNGCQEDRKALSSPPTCFGEEDLVCSSPRGVEGELTCLDGRKKICSYGDWVNHGSYYDPINLCEYGCAEEAIVKDTFEEVKCRPDPDTCIDLGNTCLEGDVCCEGECLPSALYGSTCQIPGSDCLTEGCPEGFECVDPWSKDPYCKEIGEDEDQESETSGNLMVYVSPSNSNEFCVRSKWSILPFIEDKCFPRKQLIELKNLDTIDELTDVDKTKRNYLEDDKNPLCIVEFGDLMCKEEGICLAAKDSKSEFYQYNKIVYDGIYDVVLTTQDKLWGFLTDVLPILKGEVFSLPVLGLFDEQDDKQELVEAYGVCTFPEDKQDSISGIKRWIAKTFDWDINDPKVGYALIGGFVAILIGLYLLLKPSRPKYMR